MKPILKLSLALGAAVTLALAGNASAHDGHGYGGGWHGGGGHGGYYGHGYHGGFYPGYYGYPWGYPYPYPYYYPYPPPYYGPPPDTYRGETADSMEAQVEQALAGKGYYQGKIDGIIGPMARQAIRDYQRDKGLAVTGEINDRLLKSLDLD